MEIYLDNASTSKIDKRVLAEMMPYLTEEYANPSNVYSKAQIAKQAVELSREKIAKLLNAKASEIYFTSGGSEADNWAIKGSLDMTDKKHIITTKVEHHAVLNTFKYLEKKGYNASYLNVNSDGEINLEELKNSITADTALVSIMFCNNEIGNIYPIKEISNIIKNVNSNIIFHVDAVQALSDIKIDLEDLNVDLMSFSAHKIKGPKGVGALYIRKGVRIENLIHGGDQERKKRAGTENVAGIVGFAKALEICHENFENRVKYVESLRNELLNRLIKLEGVKVNGSIKNRMPSNINVRIDGINSLELLMKMDFNSVYASSTSACSSGSLEPSHVLLAMGLNDKQANSSLRLTVKDTNNLDEIIKASDIIVNSIKSLRR